MKKSILLFILFASLASTLLAQNFDYRFELTSPGSTNQKMAIAQTPDSYYNIATEDTTNINLFLSRYDKRGTFLFQKKILMVPFVPNELLLYVDVVSMKSLPDNTLLMLCNVTSTFNGVDTKDKITLLRIDSVFDIMYTKEITVSYQTAGLTRASQMTLNQSKSNCFISGNIIDSVGTKFSYLLKCDLNGNVLFSKATPQGGFTATSNYYNDGLTVAPSGSMYTSETCAGCDTTMLQKFDAAGNLLFKKAIHLQGMAYQINYHPITNQILLSGIKSAGIKWVSLFVRIDSNGNVLSSNYYQDTTYESTFRGAIPTNDKGWMIYTSKNTANLSTGDYTRMGLVKMDSTDHVQTANFYKNDCLGAINKDDFIKTNDQGYAFISPTDGFAGSLKLYFCKTDSMSKPICNSKTLNFQPHPFITDVQNLSDSSRNAQVLVQNLNDLNSPTSISSNILCIDSSINVTSIHDVFSQENYLSVSIYHHHLIINNIYGHEASINVYTADGQCILSQRDHSKKIDLVIPSSMTEGLYFYRIKTSKQTLSGKLLKYH